MNPKNLVAYVAPSLRPNQKCEACGEEFHCGASVWGCWCAEVQLNEQTRAELRQKYKNCLCRACMEKAANRAP